LFRSFVLEHSTEEIVFHVVPTHPFPSTGWRQGRRARKRGITGSEHLMGRVSRQSVLRRAVFVRPGGRGGGLSVGHG
jgi:hypothetical protein